MEKRGVTRVCSAQIRPDQTPAATNNTPRTDWQKKNFAPAGLE
jgi:hypothetical protein